MKLSNHHTENNEELIQLFIQTFSDSEGADEGMELGKLVTEYLTSTDPQDYYCFVAQQNEQLVAGVFFTKLDFKTSLKAYILSPMATLTSFQGKGIGQKLINFGLNTLKQDGIEVVTTYGDPNYYTKVGFKQITEKIIKAPLPLTYPEGWLGQSLVNDKLEAISEKPSCVDALNKPGLW